MDSVEVKGGLFGLQIVGKGVAAHLLASSVPLIAMTFLPFLFMEGDVMKLVGAIVTSPIGLAATCVMLRHLCGKVPND